MNEISIFKETVSKIDKDFKKKSGKKFEYIDMNSSKAKKYLENDKYYNKNFKNYNEKFTGEIAVCKDDDKLAGYIYIGAKRSKNEGFCQTLEVKKEYRGYGISNILLSDGIKKYGIIDLLVDKTNEVAIELYKKHGFVILDWDNKKQYWMKLKSKLNKDDTVINEGYIVNEPDIYYNKAKFDSGEINLCFITGLSGSGKSTMSTNYEKDKNVEVVHLDDLQCIKDDFTMDNLKEYGDLIYSYFNGHGKKWYITYDELVAKDDKGNYVLNFFENYERDLYQDFIKYAISYSKIHKDKKYILEGIWIYMNISYNDKKENWFDIKFFKDYALYIKGTSMLISKIRAAKRDSSDAKNKFERVKAFTRHISRNWKYYIIDEKRIKEFRDYYGKLAEQQESIKESVSIYNSSSYEKDINFRSLLKYKNIIVGEIHNRGMIQIYDKLLSIFKPDFFICEFADRARYFTREEIKERLDNCRDETSSPKSDDNVSCFYGYNRWCYELAYKYNIPLIGCNPGDKSNFKSMDEEDKYRESYMLKTIDEFTSKGKCVIQLGDHHLRSIPFDIGFLKFSNQTKDDRGIYKSINQLIVSNSSPIWDKYNNKSDTIIYRVKEEYETEKKYSIDSTNESVSENSLLNYKRININKESISKYKSLFRGLSHVKDNSFGYIYLDKDTVVGFIACENKDNIIWIQGLEINPRYRSKGLGTQLLNIACKNLKATHLSVNKKNTIAKKMYDTYGFTVYDETETMYFMKK